MFDPFSQLVVPSEEIKVTEKTVYVPEPPKLIFGIDEKIFAGIIFGILILNLIQEVGK